MKVIVTYMVWSDQIHGAMDDVTSGPIKASEQDINALKILTCGAVERVGGNFDLVAPDLVRDTILNGDESLKEAYMLDPYDDTPWDEETFKAEFNRELADIYLNRAADNLSEPLQDLHYAIVMHRPHRKRKADMDKEIVQGSFLAYEVVEPS